MIPALLSTILVGSEFQPSCRRVKISLFTKPRFPCFPNQDFPVFQAKISLFYAKISRFLRRFSGFMPRFSGFMSTFLACTPIFPSFKPRFSNSMPSFPVPVSKQRFPGSMPSWRNCDSASGRIPSLYSTRRRRPAARLLLT